MEIFSVLGRRWEFQVDATIRRDVLGTEQCQLTDLRNNSHGSEEV